MNQMNSVAGRHSGTWKHSCPDPADLPEHITPDDFDALSDRGEAGGIHLLADLYAMGRADRTLLHHRLHVAWMGKRHGEWIDIELTRRMFREVVFSVNGHPVTRPKRPLTLFRAAPVAQRTGVAWTTTPEAAAGIGSYNDDGSSLWTVTVAPDQLLAFIDFEDEFVVDLEGIEPTLVDPGQARAHRRTLRAVERWKRREFRPREWPRHYLYGSDWFPVAGDTTGSHEHIQRFDT